MITDPDDVTAREIASAAAWILIITADLRQADKNAAAAGAHEPHRMLDTAAGWWRATEIAEAHDSYDDITFRTWASSDDLGESLSAESQSRLRGAWLTALFAGSRSEAGWPLALQARHELQHNTWNCNGVALKAEPIPNRQLRPSRPSA